MSKPTPGPWTWMPYFDDQRYLAATQRVDNSPTWDCAVLAADGAEGDLYIRVRDADSRLIAAAPELLEALQRIMVNHCPLAGNPSHDRLSAFWEYEKTQGRGEADDQLFALAAIAKATGESP